LIITDCEELFKLVDKETETDRAALPCDDHRNRQVERIRPSGEVLYELANEARSGCSLAEHVEQHDVGDLPEPVATAGAAEADREGVPDQPAAAVDEVRRPVGETRPTLLDAVGEEPLTRRLFGAMVCRIAVLPTTGWSGDCVL